MYKLTVHHYILYLHPLKDCFNFCAYTQVSMHCHNRNGLYANNFAMSTTTRLVSTVNPVQ